LRTDWYREPNPLELLLEARADDATSLAAAAAAAAAGLPDDEVIGCESKRSCSSFDWKQWLHRSLRQAFDSNDLQIDDMISPPQIQMVMQFKRPTRRRSVDEF
jgi:hypothetical protein